jgi:hypothetical protein
MWIKKKDYELMIDKHEKEMFEKDVEIEKLKYEIKDLKAAIPYKDQLKTMPLSKLIDIAINVYGIPRHYLNTQYCNKADLIQDILDAVDDLKKL